MIEELNISDELYKKITEIFYKKSGILLKDYKKYLVVNRLAKFIGSEKQYKNFQELYEGMLSDKSNQLLPLIVNALTTNFSYFFREAIHFDFLKFYFQNKIKDKKILRIWSAASSSGEEAYSIAITAFENIAKIEQLDFKILASDISTRVIDDAVRGEYKKDKIEQVCGNYITNKYFDDYGDYYRAKDILKKVIVFRYLNLLGGYPFKKNFDIIFLRNALIYFDPKEKTLILNKIYNYLADDGYLVLGQSESIANIKTSFKLKKHSIYVKEQ